MDKSIRLSLIRLFKIKTTHLFGAEINIRKVSTSVQTLSATDMEQITSKTLKFVKLSKNAITPTKGSKFAAGYDLHRYDFAWNFEFFCGFTHISPLNKGDRIAQLICERIFYPEIEEVEKLDSTERGEGGFGSSGK
ncbi:Deoxyuridine 5'-triphosphate nucleotidohydrolase, mitochondrial [Nymphon striatum]|nr:Deoxyuridine 5'-triphosphate nucleotidohydrolase, mitochondrial [Nymphon striatum]